MLLLEVPLKRKGIREKKERKEEEAITDEDGGGNSGDAAPFISELQLFFFGSIEAQMWRPSMGRRSRRRRRMRRGDG